MDADCLWRPKPDKNSPLRRFTERIERRYEKSFKSYRERHRWSCDNYAKFWGEVWEFCEVKASEPYTQVVDEAKNIQDIPEWFSGARLNYAENLLKKNNDDVAIYSAGELLGPRHYKQLTFRQLRDEVGKYAAALRVLGVRKGDRVAGYLPNCLECATAMLAAASIGAVWSSTSPEFGVAGVIERLSQVEPRVLFSVEAVKYNGKTHDHLAKLSDVVKQLPSVKHVVIVPNQPMSIPEEAKQPVLHRISLEEFLKTGQLEDGSYPDLEFEQVPFDHPLFIMFSSGTTGLPKCMVHSVGGTLLKHLEEHRLQSCLSDGDILFFYSTVGWMMWNWLISALATGASIVIYDGSPFVPKLDVLFDLVDVLKVTVLGMGAKCYDLFEMKGVKPKVSHDLSSLKALLSTGSPLKPQSFDYVYENVKEDVLIGSISGGTDIIACFMGNCWELPVYRGECQCLFLGCDMESWDETGHSVRDESGELVCLKPIPSAPTHFLNDPGRKRYRAAYFDKFPDVWAHGDFCMINSKTGGVVMLGRSDGTLNPGGVRFGSAEIYHIVETIPMIEDSLCVGQRLPDGDERVILFLKLANGGKLKPEMISAVKKTIRTSLSPRHIPALILQISDIPYTTSGKKVEVAVRRVLEGGEVQNRGALRNPEALDAFLDIPELRI